MTSPVSARPATGLPHAPSSSTSGDDGTLVSNPRSASQRTAPGGGPLQVLAESSSLRRMRSMDASSRELDLASLQAHPAPEPEVSAEASVVAAEAPPAAAPAPATTPAPTLATTSTNTLPRTASPPQDRRSSSLRFANTPSIDSSEIKRSPSMTGLPRHPVDSAALQPAGPSLRRDERSPQAAPENATPRHEEAHEPTPPGQGEHPSLLSPGERSESMRLPPRDGHFHSSRFANTASIDSADIKRSASMMGLLRHPAGASFRHEGPSTQAPPENTALPHEELHELLSPGERSDSKQWSVNSGMILGRSYSRDSSVGGSTSLHFPLRPPVGRDMPESSTAGHKSTTASGSGVFLPFQYSAAIRPGERTESLPINVGTRRFPASSELQIDGRSVSVSHLRSRVGHNRSDQGNPAGPVRPVQAEVATDIAELTPEQQVVAHELRQLHWPAHISPESLTEQVGLEKEYAAWAGGVLAARQKAFGAHSYTMRQDMSTPLHSAFLASLYDGARQFIIGTSRSPLRNAIVVATGPHRENGKLVGELRNDPGPAMVGGVASGLTAYAVDAWLIQAMDRRAKISNFPSLAAVDLKALIPVPGPVCLRVRNDVKEYWRPAVADGSVNVESGNAVNSLGDGQNSSHLALKHKAKAARDLLKTKQSTLDAKGLATGFQPGVMGAGNVVRRLASSASSLKNPLELFGGTLLASSSAGALGKFMIGMVKATPHLAQAEVDNLIGGTQRVNLYSVKLKNPEVPAAGWNDIKRLPHFIGGTLVEAGALAKQTLGPKQTWANRVCQTIDISRVVLASTAASVAQSAAGPFVAQFLRDGAPAPLIGESSKSGANLLQQFAQSTVNDFTFNAVKDYTKDHSYDLGAELDEARDRKQQMLQLAAQPQTQTLRRRPRPR